MFSKICYEAGLYDHLSIDDVDCTIVKDYCVYIALKAKQEMPWLLSKGHFKK
jgi:hypothetical protein